MMVALKVRILILLQCFINLSVTQAKFVTFVTEHKLTCNPNFLQCKSWVTYTKENDTSTYLDHIDYDVLVPGINYITVNLKIFTNPIGKRNESTKIMDINADVCKFYKRNNGANPFTTYLIGLSQRYGKTVGCPAKVGHYYAHNLTINGKDGFPNFTGYFLGKGEGSIEIKYRAKIGKRSFPMMNATIIGGYKNVK